MKKKILCLILILVIAGCTVVPALAENPGTIHFKHHTEDIELLFSDVLNEEAVSETVKDNSSIPLFSLTVSLGSTVTEILSPGVSGLYTIFAEDSNGKSLNFSSDYTAAELDTLIFITAINIDRIRSDILTNGTTPDLEEELKNAEELYLYYLKLKDNIKRGLNYNLTDKVKNTGAVNRSNTSVRRETTYEFVKTGTFMIWFKSQGVSGYSAAIKLTVGKSQPVTQPDETPQAPSPSPDTPSALIAVPTAQAVYINGELTPFDAYNIDGSNYFKLRDLAYMLTVKDSKKQFNVSWDAETSSIILTSGHPYIVVGGEMSGKGASNKTPIPTGAKILLDGKEISFTAYNIEGNNYFKLRDVGQAFDFGVFYDAAANSVTIDPSSGYTEG